MNWSTLEHTGALEHIGTRCGRRGRRGAHPYLAIEVGATHGPKREQAGPAGGFQDLTNERSIHSGHEPHKAPEAPRSTHTHRRIEGMGMLGRQGVNR